MRYNDTVTLYVPFRRGNEYTFVRVVVPGCHWEENSIQVFRQTGNTVASNFEIIFPRRDSDPKQILSSEWAALPNEELENHYALALVGVVDVIWQTPRAYRGILDTRFGWNTSTATSTAMNNLAREHGLVTLRDVNYNWYGNRRLHHIVVR